MVFVFVAAAAVGEDVLHQQQRELVLRRPGLEHELVLGLVLELERLVCEVH